jgi:predicted ATPase/DNA-binding SARP family transcriptional activator/DNA-binding CsgD family transcriptional regulator
MARATMEFRVLGPLEVRRRGRALALGGPQQRALLAILLIRPNRVISTERMGHLLWGDDAPATAGHTIGVYVSNLRRILEPRGAPFRILVRTNPGYVLQIRPTDLDAAQFESLVNDAKQLPPRERAAQLSGALRLWRGPAFADFPSQPFVLAEATRLNELRLHALEERLDADLVLGRHQQLVGELEGLVAEHPLRERLCGQLMLALYRSGRQAEASAVYQRTRERLVEELGMEPGAELQSVLKGILKHDPGLAHQAALSAPANLPLQLTSFIGREKELRELDQLVRESRLVTLAGPGGCGKTRLALRIGANITDRFPDGVWFIDLSALTEPDFVSQAVATSLGITEQPGRTSLLSVCDHLQGRSALLILDNCEQILDAAARMAEVLVKTCPDLHVLATSRERLRVEGEHLYQLPPLALPDAGLLAVAELEQSEAVQLFVDRARMSVPSFSVTSQNALSVAQLCRQLDGIPLAIELAAAHTGTLTPNDILARLDDQFGILAAGMRTRSPRQRSLRATLDWSYHLLTAAEAALFRRLSVFSGGFDLNAAESVGVDEQVKPTEVAALVAELCNKSLVTSNQRAHGATRYRLLDTVRAFAARLLAEGGEEGSVRRRHATFYLELVNGAMAGIEGPEGKTWLDRMETEHDNARAALVFSISADPDLACRLAVAWSPFWFIRGHFSEGSHWLSAVLAAQDQTRDWSRDQEAAYRLAEVKQQAGRMALRLGDMHAAQSYADEAMQIAQALGDKGMIASLLADLAALARMRGDGESARSLFAQSLRVLREVGSTEEVPGHPTAIALEAAVNVALGQGAAWSGDYITARNHYRQTLERLELTGGRRWVSISLGLGEVALVEGDIGEATRWFAGALSEAQRLGDLQGIAAGLAYSAGLAAASANPVAAMRLQGASSKLVQALGLQGRMPSPFDRTVKPRLESVYSQLGRREAEIQMDAGRALSPQQAVDYAFGDVLKGSETFSTEEAIAYATRGRDQRSRSSTGWSSLSPSELEVVRLVGQHLTNPQIASRLFVSRATVKTHLVHVFAKLGINSRSELAAEAIARGMAGQPEQTLPK